MLQLQLGACSQGGLDHLAGLPEIDHSQGLHLEIEADLRERLAECVREALLEYVEPVAERIVYRHAGGPGDETTA